MRPIWTAAYSADGNQIAVHAHRRGFGGFIGLAEEGDLRSLSSGDVSVTDFAWTPTGDLVLAVRAEGPEDAVDHDRLVVMSTAGTVLRSVVPSSQMRFGFGMAVTSDGQRIVAAVMDPADGTAMPADLAWVDLDSGSVVRITDTPELSETWPSLTADEARVVYAIGPDPRVTTSGPSRVAVLDLATGQTSPLSPDDFMAFSPRMDASGQMVLFAGWPGSGSRFDRAIYAVPLNGRGSPVLIANVDGVPVSSHPVEPLVLVLLTLTTEQDAAIQELPIKQPTRWEPVT